MLMAVEPFGVGTVDEADLGVVDEVEAGSVGVFFEGGDDVVDMAVVELEVLKGDKVRIGER